MAFNDLSDFDKGWVVALIEGEGHIGRSGNTDKICVEMCDKDVIEKYHTLVESKTKVYSYPRVQGGVKKKLSYSTQLSGPRARLLMVDIFPYMSERKQLQIQNVILGGLNG